MPQVWCNKVCALDKIFSWFQKNCMTFRSSNLSIKSLDAHKNASLDVTGVQFKRSFWTATGSDLYFDNCDLTLLQIQIFGRVSNTAKHIHILNSQIGGLMFLHSVAATLKNCSAFHIRISNHTTFISTMNSTINVTSSHIAHFQGGCFLQTSKGTTFLQDVEFVNCFSANTLVSAVMESTLSVHKCRFISNKNPAIDVRHKSVGIVKNSIVKQNSVLSSKSTQFLVRSYLGSMLLVQNTFFSRNIILNGYAAIGCVYWCACVIEKSYFIGNEGRAISLKNSFQIVITNCTFVENTAPLDAGAAVALDLERKNLTNGMQAVANLTVFAHQHQNTTEIQNHDTIAKHNVPLWQINKCKFINNTGGIGGAISVKNVSLTLTENHFINNSAFGAPAHGQGKGGGVFLKDSPTNITSCVFKGNKAWAGGGIAVSGRLLSINSSIFVENEAVKDAIGRAGAIHAVILGKNDPNDFWIFNSTFHENKASDEGGAIYTETAGGIMNVEQTTFLRNSAGIGGAIFSSHARMMHCSFEANFADLSGGALTSIGNVNISHCNFTNNAAGRGGAMTAGSNTKFTCSLCYFHNNTAVSR